MICGRHGDGCMMLLMMGCAKKNMYLDMGDENCDNDLEINTRVEIARNAINDMKKVKMSPRTNAFLKYPYRYM